MLSSYEEPRPAGELDWRNGVFVDQQGRQHIDTGGHWYRVKYDADNGTLRVTHPDDAGKPAYPVRAKPDGTFEVHSEVGLKGGGPKSAPRELTEGEKQGVRRLLDRGMTAEDVARQLGMPLQQVRGVLHGQAVKLRKAEVTLTPEKQQEIVQLIKQGLNSHEVAGRAGVSRDSVYKIAKSHGLKLPVLRRLPVETRQKIADLLGEGFEKAEIGRRLHVDPNTVSTIGEEYGFMKNQAMGRRISDEKVQSAVELLKLGLAKSEVAEQLSISHVTVSRIARTHHIPSVTLPGGAALSEGIHENVLERLNQGQSPQKIAKDLRITPASVERIRSRNMLADALSDFVATMGPDMTEAVQANLSRRLGRSSTSPPEGEGTSTGGQTRASEGTGTAEPPQKRPRPASAEAESDDVDEIIPPYVDELMDKLGPEKLPLVQTVWDDAVVLLDAESRYAPGSPEPHAAPDPEAAAVRLDTDVAAVIAALSDEDTDFLLHLSDEDRPKEA